MATSKNMIDYGVLQTGASTYHKNAQQIDTVLKQLKTMNSQLQAGWNNQTADAFITRFNSEYAPALKKASEAVESISTYITKYVQATQNADAAAAKALKGNVQ